MNPAKNLPMVLGIGLILGLVSSCAQASSPVPGPAPESDPAQMINSGSWYVRERWPHDGNPYESDNFIIYSDAASLAARESFAVTAEEVFADLIAEFQIDTDQMFRYPEGQDKIHVYAYKNHHPLTWGGRAYHGGLFMWSPDHEQRNPDPANHRSVFQHELVHVMESLLKGRDSIVGEMTHTWFSEGLAEAVTGGTSGGAVRNLDYLHHLTGIYGELSPTLYVQDEPGRDVMAYFVYHYPMSQLAVEYLMDPEGLGKSPMDVVAIFVDMADGAEFPDAFEKHMGITLGEYEDQFFDLINGYLDAGEPTTLKRMWWAWLALTAGSLLYLILSLARGTAARWDSILAWVLEILLFGPLGLLSYLRSYKRPERSVSHWWRALGASTYSVTGNAVGLILILVSVMPDGDAGPLILVIPLIVGWLIFRTPLMSKRFGYTYWVAARRSLLAELMSTIFVLGGMLAVLMLLAERAWFFSLDPKDPLFWGALVLGAVAGTLIVYPYSFWMVRRDAAPWPGWAMAESHSG